MHDEPFYDGGGESRQHDRGGQISKRLLLAAEFHGLLPPVSDDDESIARTRWRLGSLAPTAGSRRRNMKGIATSGRDKTISDRVLTQLHNAIMGQLRGDCYRKGRAENNRVDGRAALAVNTPIALLSMP